MDCREVQRKLSAYMDNEIDAAEKEMVLRHLESCEACAHQLSLLLGGQDYLRRSAVIEASPDFKARFWQKVREQEDVKADGLWERLVQRWVPVPVAGAALIVLFSGFSVFSPMVYGDTDSPRRQAAVKLAVETFTPAGCRHLFGPMRFAEFCDGCSGMLCKKSCCADGTCPKCNEKGDVNHD